MKTGVVGLGLIGGSLLRALGGAGYDADPAVRAAGCRRGLRGRRAARRPRRLRAGARGGPAGRAPPTSVGEVLATLPEALVADTASVKGGLPAPSGSSAPIRWPARRPRAGRRRRASLLPGRTVGRLPGGRVARAAARARRGRRRARRPARRLHARGARRGGRAHEPRPAPWPRRRWPGSPSDGGLHGRAGRHRLPRHDARGARRRRRCGRRSCPPTARPCLAAVDELVARLGRPAHRARRRRGDPRRVGAGPGVARRGRRPAGASRTGARRPWTAGPGCSRTGARAARCGGCGSTTARRCARRWRDEAPVRPLRAAARQRSTRRPTSRSRTAPRCSRAMTSDPVRVTGYLDAADTNATLAAVEALGRAGRARARRADDPRHRAARGRRPRPG